MESDTCTVEKAGLYGSRDSGHLLFLDVDASQGHLQMPIYFRVVSDTLQDVFFTVILSHTTSEWSTKK